MLMRICFGVGSGAVATFLLFLLMQGFIKSDRSPFDEAVAGHVVDFVRVEEDIEIKNEPRLPPPPPPPPDEMPPDPPKPEFDQSEKRVGYEILPPKEQSVVPPAGPGRFADGDYVPFFKVDPKYPGRALRQEIEGYVLLEFTVTQTGAVRDPVVIEASPPGIFERAAQQAALKFKYRPRVINGTPIEVSGVLNRIIFNLRDD